MASFVLSSYSPCTIPPLVLQLTYHGVLSVLEAKKETLELFPANFEFVDPGGLLFRGFLVKVFEGKFPPSSK